MADFLSPANYTVKELIQDPSFQRLAKGYASLEEIEKWDKWIEHSPQNRATFKTAISEIVGFEFNSQPTPDMEKQWGLLFSKTAGRERKMLQIRRNKNLNWIFRIAAVLVLITTVWAGSQLFSDESIVITQLEQLIEERTINTADNEQKTMKFSNGSSIVLNSNSTISYRISERDSQTIHVSLDGEAWFVAEESPGQTEPVFSVSTPNGIIQDIGTEFLVSVHESGSRVVIQEGLVEISPFGGRYADQAAESEKMNSYRVEKGELIEFNNDEILDRRLVNPTFYSSWATGFMQLNRTSLDEFARYVEQRYNVKAEIADTELSGITLDGAVYFKTLEGLVQSVSKVTGIPVYRSALRDTVYIGNPQDRAMTTEDDNG